VGEAVLNDPDLLGENIGEEPSAKQVGTSDSSLVVEGVKERLRNESQTYGRAVRFSSA